MKKLTLRSSLLLAGAFAGIMAASAPFAVAADYTQIKDGLTAQFVTLGVPSENLGALTIAQLTELTAQLNTSETDVNKAAAANVYLETALMPTRVAIDSPEGMAMVAALQGEFLAINEPYPTQALSTMQVQTLLNVFVNYPMDKNSAADQKLAIDAAMSSFGMPGSEVSTAEGTVQIEEQVYAKLTALGITTPPSGTLSAEKLNKIYAIFNRDATDASKKDAAVLVLSE